MALGTVPDRDPPPTGDQPLLHDPQPPGDSGAMRSVPAPEDVQAAFAAVLVDEWLRAGVSAAVACPGSRSTPLLVALAEAAERGALRLYVLADERSAGFFAVGLATATGVPAPVVTTSGTAATELHPAVVEAHHAGVPMLAVTTDRPEELHGFGAPQTVDQTGLFGTAVRWEVHPGPLTWLPRGRGGLWRPGRSPKRAAAPTARARAPQPGLQGTSARFGRVSPRGRGAEGGRRGHRGGAGCSRRAGPGPGPSAAPAG